MINEQVAGHLRVKKGVFYIILNYKLENGPRKYVSFSTGLKEKGNKKKAEFILNEVKQEFRILSSEKEQEAERKRISYYINCLIENKKPDENIMKPYKIFHNVTVSTLNIEMEQDMLFTDYLKKWMFEIERNEIAETTYSKYQNNMAYRILPYFNSIEDLKLCTLTAVHLQQFYTDLQHGYEIKEKKYKPLSVITIERYHSLLHRALDYAYKMGLLKENISNRTSRPKVCKKTMSVYTSDELDVLFKKLEGHDLEYIIKITAYYGLRKSELFGLTWDCIDWNKKTVSIKQTFIETWEKGKPLKTKIVPRAKTESSLRTYPLTPYTEEIFKKIKENKTHYMEKLKDKYNHKNDDMIFTRPNGDLYVPSNVSHQFQRFLEKNGLKKIRFHDLRHSCASLLYEAGVPLKDIQAWLGHAQLSVTADIYTHLRDNAKEKSADKLDQIFPMKKSSL